MVCLTANSAFFCRWDAGDKASRMERGARPGGRRAEGTLACPRNKEGRVTGTM
jgi:hypothetical protein